MTMRILIGDARERLRELPDESVHCVVTSPPYYGLRDYGTAVWDGGDSECDHQGSKPSRKANAVATSGLEGGKSSIHLSIQFNGDCGRCGAKRIDRQIGLEPSPAEYVETLVAVFHDVRRVLRKDGTLWLNLGDSYAGGGGGNYGNKIAPDHGQHITNVRNRPDWLNKAALKPKDLLGIPWMVAFALRADGWWLRQDLIWSKPNPMPESVTDRCTKAHEYLFLLSKSERYWFDQSAILEPAAASSIERLSQPTLSEQTGSDRVPGKTNGRMRAVGRSGPNANSSLQMSGKGGFVVEYRNKRSVWEITTQPYAEAHFATFPPALVEPCILAGCPKGGTVLDPFFGAGTTGIVADRLGRDCIGIELNPAYAEMTRARLVDDAGMFANVEFAA